MTDQGSDQHHPDPRRAETVTSETAPIPSGVPDRIGRYHIKRVIASGGMGTVYEATQDNPRRVVAVKVMKQGIASKSALRRFEYEGQILGRLRHPGIAQIYEAGTHHDPAAPGAAVPYFAMEYIPNAKLITKYADEKKLGTRQRMELFAKVCDAIHHGHQKGIIHRDLKPSNILVTPPLSPPLGKGGSGGVGEVKIIDFGVARCTDSDLAVTTLQTDVGQLIGTLQYMSPEQCEGDPHDIDTRSDVYALGVVFYQLLCGMLPYDVTRMAMHQATRAIREQTPTKLSTMDRTLRGDVETIALKALEKERERRYQSAADFGLDIQRYLTGEAILAHRASIVYQLRVFARRNKAVFASLAAVFLVLVAGIIVSSSLYLRAEGEAERAKKERDKAERIASFMGDILKGAGPSVSLGRDATMLREMLDGAANRIKKGELKDSPEAELQLRLTLGETYRELGVYEHARELLEPSVPLAQKLYGEEHPLVATSLYDLADVFLSQRIDYREAEKLLRKALAMRRKLLGKEHREVAESLYGLAVVIMQRGFNHTEADQLFREALSIRRKLFGEESLDTIMVLHELANNLTFQDRYDEAEPLFREVLAVQRKIGGDEHLDVAQTLHNLAYTLEGKGQYDEAEQVERESLAMAQKFLGSEHPELISSLQVLVGLVERRGDFEEVERLARQELSICQAKLPPDHVCWLFAASPLGRALTHRGQFVEAEPLLLQVYNGWKGRNLVPDLQAATNREAMERIVWMYNAWDAAEPGKGYAEKAAEWRKKLEETSKSQNAETSKP